MNEVGEVLQQDHPCDVPARLIGLHHALNILIPLGGASWSRVDRNDEPITTAASGSLRSWQTVERKPIRPASGATRSGETARAFGPERCERSIDGSASARIGVRMCAGVSLCESSGFFHVYSPNP